MFIFLLYIVLSLVALFLLYKILIKPVLAFLFTFYIECLPGRIAKIDEKIEKAKDPTLRERLEKKRDKLKNALFLWKN